MKDRGGIKLALLNRPQDAGEDFLRVGSKRRASDEDEHDQQASGGARHE